MRKLFVLLLFLSNASFSFSQTVNKKETSTTHILDTIKLKAAAIEFCNCFAVISDSIHPYLLEMVEISAKNGEKVAEDTLTVRLTANPDQIDPVMKSMTLMEGDKFEATLTKCLGVAEKKYPSLSQENDTDGKINNSFIEMMGRMPACKFIYLLMKVGQKEDD